MKRTSVLLSLGAGAMVAANPAAASPAGAGVAGPTGYDCDAPVDQYGVQSRAMTLPVSISGTISVRSMRSKDYYPSISVAIVDADRTRGAGFQITAPDDNAEELEVTSIDRKAGVDTEVAHGRVLARATIPFTLSATTAGEVAMMVNGVAFGGSIRPGPGKNLAVTCTSGHFSVLSVPAGPTVPDAAAPAASNPPSSPRAIPRQ